MSGPDWSADIITHVDLSRRPFVATGDSASDRYVSPTRSLSRPGRRHAGSVSTSETRFRGFGVSACATRATDFSSAARPSPSSAAAIPRSRKRCS